MWLCKLRSTTIVQLQVEDSGKLVEYFENLGAEEPMMYTVLWLNQSGRERVNSPHLKRLDSCRTVKSTLLYSVYCSNTSIPEPLHRHTQDIV